MHLVKNQSRLWSQNSLATEFDLARQTVKKRLLDVPPDGMMNGHPAWTLKTAAPALVSPFGAVDAEDPDTLPPDMRLKHWQAEKEQDVVKVQRRQLIPADDVESGLAKIIKLVVQFLDTMPDVLERDTGINGAAVERVQRACDGLREQLYQQVSQ